MAQELLQAARPHVQGVYIMPSFGRDQVAAEVLDALGQRVTERRNQLGRTRRLAGNRRPPPPPRPSLRGHPAPTRSLATPGLSRSNPSHSIRRDEPFRGTRKSAAELDRTVRCGSRSGPIQTLCKLFERSRRFCGATLTGRDSSWRGCCHTGAVLFLPQVPALARRVLSQPRFHRSRGGTRTRSHRPRAGHQCRFEHDPAGST